MKEQFAIYYGVTLLMKMKLGFLIVEAPVGCLDIRLLMNLIKSMGLNSFAEHINSLEKELNIGLKKKI